MDLSEPGWSESTTSQPCFLVPDSQLEDSTAQPDYEHFVALNMPNSDRRAGHAAGNKESSATQNIATVLARGSEAADLECSASVRETTGRSSPAASGESRGWPQRAEGDIEIEEDEDEEDAMSSSERIPICARVDLPGRATEKTGFTQEVVRKQELEMRSGSQPQATAPFEAAPAGGQTAGASRTQSQSSAPRFTHYQTTLAPESEDFSASEMIPPSQEAYGDVPLIIPSSPIPSSGSSPCEETPNMTVIPAVPTTTSSESPIPPSQPLGDSATGENESQDLALHYSPSQHTETSVAIEIRSQPGPPNISHRSAVGTTGTSGLMQQQPTFSQDSSASMPQFKMRRPTLEGIEDESNGDDTMGKQSVFDRARQQTTALPVDTGDSEDPYEFPCSQMPSKSMHSTSPTDQLTLTASETHQKVQAQPPLRLQATFKGDVSLDSEVDFPLLRCGDIESEAVPSAIPEPMKLDSLSSPDQPVKQVIPSAPDTALLVKQVASSTPDAALPVKQVAPSAPAAALQSSVAAFMSKPSQGPTSSSSTGKLARPKSHNADNSNGHLTLTRSTGSGTEKKRQKASQRRLSQSWKSRSSHNTKSRLPASHPRQKRRAEQRHKQSSSEAVCVEWVESSTAPAALARIVAGSSSDQQTKNPLPTTGTAKVKPSSSRLAKPGLALLPSTSSSSLAQGNPHGTDVPHLKEQGVQTTGDDGGMVSSHATYRVLVKQVTRLTSTIMETRVGDSIQTTILSQKTELLSTECNVLDESLSTPSPGRSHSKSMSSGDLGDISSLSHSAGSASLSRSSLGKSMASSVLTSTSPSSVPAATSSRQPVVTLAPPVEDTLILETAEPHAGGHRGNNESDLPCAQVAHNVMLGDAAPTDQVSDQSASLYSSTWSVGDKRLSSDSSRRRSSSSLFSTFSSTKRSSSSFTSTSLVEDQQEPEHDGPFHRPLPPRPRPTTIEGPGAKGQPGLKSHTQLPGLLSTETGPVTTIQEEPGAPVSTTEPSCMPTTSVASLCHILPENIPRPDSPAIGLDLEDDQESWTRPVKSTSCKRRPPSIDLDDLELEKWLITTQSGMGRGGRGRRGRPRGRGRGTPARSNTPKRGKKGAGMVPKQIQMTTQPETQGTAERPGPAGSPVAGTSSRPGAMEELHSDPRVLHPGTPVMAMWKDKFFYPGHITALEVSGKYTVAFEDGDVRQVKTCDLLVLELVDVGESVMADRGDNWSEKAIVVGHSGAPKPYMVELDGGNKIRLARSQVFLSQDQAATLRRPSTCPAPPADSSANVSLDNLIEGKRRRSSLLSTPASHVKGDTPGNTSSTTQKGSTAKSTRKQAVAMEMEESSSTTSATKRKLEPEATSTPTPKRQTRARQGGSELPSPLDSVYDSPQTARVPKASKAVLFGGSKKGPIPPAGSELFVNMAFLLTHAERNERQRQYERDLVSNVTCESNLETDESSNWEEDEECAFDKDHLSRQIIAGGGTILDDFDPQELSAYQQCFLISDSYQRTKKYFLVLAAGITCVSHLWVRDCCALKSLQDFRAYTLPSGLNIETNRPVELSGGACCLRGMCVLVASDKKRFHEVWDIVLETAGCTVHTRLQARAQPQDLEQFDVVIGDRSIPHSLRRVLAAADKPVLSSEWLIQCLVQGQRPHVNGHSSYITSTT